MMLMPMPQPYIMDFAANRECGLIHVLEDGAAVEWRLHLPKERRLSPDEAAQITRRFAETVARCTDA